MDIYILDHNIQLQTTMEEIKNEIRTELFLNLQNEKIRIKNELITELHIEKLRMIVDVKIKTDKQLEQLRMATSLATDDTNSDQNATHRSNNSPEIINGHELITSPDRDKPFNLMGRYPIDISGGRHPILTLHQFQYPIRTGQPIIQVESHKFQKATINI